MEDYGGPRRTLLARGRDRPEDQAGKMDDHSLLDLGPLVSLDNLSLFLVISVIHSLLKSSLVIASDRQRIDIKSNPTISYIGWD